MATTRHRRHTHYTHHRWLIEQQKQHPPSARLLLNTATQATNCGHSHPLFKCSNVHIKVILLMMAIMIWTKMIGLNISSTTIRPQPLNQQLPINSLHNDDHQTRSNFMLMMMMMIIIIITTTASSVIHPRRSSVVTVLPSLLLLASFVTSSPPPPPSSSSSSSSAIVEISKSSAAKFDFGQSSSSSSSSTNNNAGGGAGTSIDGSIKEHGALSTTTNTASDSSDRWHTVSAYVGSELSLPCAVDVSGCGRIYFITWTKNVSTSMMGPILDTVSDNDQAQVDSSIMNNDNDQHHSSLHSSTPSSVSSVPNSNNNNNKNGEWQRVFIHSDTFERVLGDLEQFGPKNRVHFGPENLSKTNFAHLTLRTVVPEDEGVYKCDVTYVTPHAHGKCPSLTYIRVQTLVKPSSPTIRINGKPLSEYRLDDTKGPNSSAKATLTSSSSSSDIDLLRYNQIGPFEEGSTIVFECSTFGGRPMPELRWFNGSRPLRSKITVVDLDPTPDNSEQLDQQQQQQQQQPQPHSVNSEAKSKVLATTRIIASRYDLGAKFECRVLWNSSDFIGQNQPQQHHHNHLHHNASLLNDWLLLDIKVRPLSIRVDSPRSPVMAGETVLLRCTVDGARPPANITWYNRSEVVNAQPLPSLNHLIGVHNNNKQQQQQSGIHHFSSDNNGNIKIGAVGSLWGANQQPLQQQQQSQPRTRMTTELMTDGTYRSTSILAFVASRSDHQADFFCKGSNEILRNRNEVPLLQGVSLQVLYPPVVAIEPDGLIAVNESSTIQFWCTYDANPMNITEIRWYKNHRPIVLPEWSNENSKIWSALDERGTPTLTIKDIDRNDSAEYGCFIKNRLGASDSITTAKLEVAFPPVVVLEVIEPKNQIIEEHSNLPLPKLTLKCSTVMGNPPNLLAVHWYRNGHHFLTTVSFRHLQAQQQQQQQLQSNQVSTSTSSSIPSFFHHSFYHRIGTGKHFTLVDESTPLDGPVNGQFLLSSNGTYTEPYVHYLDEPELLIIANVTREHAGNYSCLGFNGASNASQLSEAKFVTVKYPPGPATLTLTPPNRFILKGAQALLECRIDDPGDPPAHTIIWTHNGVRIDRATTQFKSATDSSNKNPLVARYRTPKADMTTSGEYRCRALNDLGQGEWALFRLDVKSAPKLLEALPSTIGALSDQNLTLTCRVECQPPCEIHWFHNNLTKLSPDTRGILVSPLMTNEYRVKLRNGNELTFSVINEQTESLQGPAQTSSTLFIYNTSMLFDFDQLTCVSSNSDNEELGPPVYSSVIFRREYPPHSVHLSMPGIDLLEGEGYPEKPILCSAFGNPSPQYHWTFEPFLVTMTPGLMDHLSEPAGKNQTVVAIGPRLNLDKSIAQGRIMLNKQQHDANEEMTSSTTVPGRFHASRTLSGNYTCVATNQHGSASAALTINVFYRPECELRRINTAKILRQQNHLHRQQPNDLHGTLEPQVPIMLSCTAISNPAPGKFSWYRRNGSELLEIHPSINSDHSLFVAISQDYDYASDGASEYFHHHHHHQNHPYMSDYVLPQSAMGHTRQSIVMGVPSDANLDEYACVVANAIGESSPCWFEESPTSDQMSATGRGNVSGDGDNLFMVAASAGLIVFCLVLFITVAIVFFLHRNRSTSSFKGFGSRGSDDATPQRFKMDRPHLLLDSSSSPEQLADVDFILDTRSKTSTLTAAYRMTNAPCNQLSTPLITGTLSKPYHQRHIQNPYSTAGSVYANSDDLDATIKGLSSSRPYLVSCPSPNNPVYAEPEYHCLESSNPSGDGQLTGSTSVTTSSGANSNTSNVQLLPPLPPDVKMRFPMGKFNMNTNKQGNQIEMDAISNQEDGDDHGERNHDHPIDDNYDNYEEVKDPRPIIASRFSSNIRKKRRKRSNNNHTRNASSPMRLSSDYSKTSESEDSGDGLPANNDDNDINREPESLECLANQLQQSQQRNKSDDQNYESYDDDDDDSSIPSTAYKPERDFFFINRQHQQKSGFRNSASSNTGSSGSRRRLLPIANKYGSLIGNNHHHQPMMSSPRYVPQQYHQSPVSTRLYYNFDHPIMPSIPQHDDPSPNPLYNSLRFGNNHLRSNNCRNNDNNSAGAGLIRQHSAGSGSSSPPPLPPFPNDSSIRPSNSVYGRRSELNEQQSFQQQPPDYHQTILDQFYEQQTTRKTNHDSENNILHR